MPFRQWDIEQEVKEKVEHEEGFKESYLQVNKEYELIKQAIQIRNEMNLTQKDVSEVTGMPQQVISRMEKLGHSPSLKNFIKYLDAMGLDINITKKI